MGSPLLDILVEVPVDFLEKYNLKVDEIRLIHEDELPFYNEIINDVVENFHSDILYTAGGSAQNAMRVAQWILDSPNACVFMGSIGNDYFGKTLFQKAVDDGIVGQYQLVSNVPTGTCLTLITKEHNKRAMLACLAAAKLFGKRFLEDPDNFNWVKKAQFYYVSAYSLSVSFDSLMYLAKYAAEKNRHFCMHLSAPYIYTDHASEFLKIYPYIDVLFGSKNEALSFGKALKYGNDVEEIGRKASIATKFNERIKRIVIFTQGHNPIIVAKANDVKKYKALEVRAGQIKDTSGAGDAFAGGFLAQLARGSSLEICLQCGIWASAEIIKQHGCQFPKNKYFKPFLLQQVK